MEQQLDNRKLLQEILRDVREIKDYLTKNDSVNRGLSNPYIRCLLEDGTERNNLIVYNQKTKFYQRNIIVYRSCKKGDWLKEANNRFAKNGLTKPNWSELGRLYLRKEDGTEYKNITKEIAGWY